MDLHTQTDLSSLNIKCVYDSATDDILKEFYIPVLSNSIVYDRMTGYFTSSALAVVSKGVAALIKNKGKMRMITSPKLSDDDIKAINDGFLDKDKYLETTLLSEIMDENSIRSDVLKALGWMISNNLLEIKIAIVVDENGKIVDDVESTGIFHKKTGILKDSKDNIVVFSGSLNETGSGWVRNVEQFDVHFSWRQGMENYIGHYEASFEKCWNDNVKGMRVVDFPDAVKRKWIENSPKRPEELKIIRDLDKIVYGERILRDYQTEAIESWISAGAKGILNMATGTGKTFTALSAIKALKEKNKEDRLISIIAVPFQHLMKNPWEDSICEMNKEEKIIIASSTNQNWKTELTNLLHKFKLGVIETMFILTTYDTFSSPQFMEKMKPLGNDILLIADEVHNAGAKHYADGLLPEYKYRLGLSATPERYFDDEGTKNISEYFGGEVFEFDLQKAITQTNPDTGETYLTPYEYNPIVVKLTDAEMVEYKNKSKQIAILSSKEKLTEKEKEQLRKIRLSRSKIVKNATRKVEAFEKLLDRLRSESELKQCLIYCSDGKDEDGEKTLKKVVQLLNARGINNHRFTARENEKERDEIITNFSNGTPGILVAIKCLDEGVDIPSTKTAIIMASTGNPREYIQRRGRVLRRSPGKVRADIFDFVVLPESKIDQADTNNSEFTLVRNEMKRFNEFSRLSMNHSNNVKIIEKELSKINISLEVVLKDV